MKFRTKPGKVINRNGKKYVADSKGIIIGDEGVKNLFVNLGFENLEKPVVKTKRK